MTRSHRTHLVDALAGRLDRPLEVGVGSRPEVARALAERGANVLAFDVSADALPVAPGPDPTTVDASGSLHFAVADLVALTDARDPVAELAERSGSSGKPEDRLERNPHPKFDAVYALNLPPELQRPARELAAALDAPLSFTTLGFEEPTVPVERRTVGQETLYVAEQRRR